MCYIQHNYTPLHDASWKGNTEMGKMLLDSNADVHANAKVSDKGCEG